MDFLRSLSEEILAGLIGTLLGFLGKTGLDFFTKRRKDKAFQTFLGFPPGEILIIHSALFDPSRGSYNYPSCDMISSRRIANLLEMIGKRENRDFRIAPESSYLTPEGAVDPEVLNYNLVLLGGPKRNKVTREVLKMAAKLRYDMQLDAKGENRLYDRRAKHEFRSSRDLAPSPAQPADEDLEGTNGYDYGLIMSMPNPLHLDRGVLLLAGLHGIGTVGAASYISERRRLQELARKRQGGVIQEVVYVKYITGSERITELIPI